MKHGVVPMRGNVFNWSAEDNLRATDLGIKIDSQEVSNQVKELLSCEEEVEKAVDARKRAEKREASAYHKLYRAKSAIEKVRKRQST